MKRVLFIFTFSFALLLSVSCYHARIETGLSPSEQVIEKSFASSWIYGLVPPSTVKAAEECPNGVAIVETELSFVNQLVGMLTLGIYTPMHIKVTCASSSGRGSLDTPGDGLVVPCGASEKEVTEVFALAAERSVETKQPVYVRFE